MKPFSFLLALIIGTCLYAQYPNPVSGSFKITVSDGVCSFNGLSIGDKLADIEKKIGKSGLITDVPGNAGMKTIFYPNHGLAFSLEGEFIREISLFPNEGTQMGDISRFKIFSRNKSEWRFDQLPLIEANPQDIMQLMGTDLSTKVGAGFTAAISNNVMGYKVINSGGAQDIIFYFNNKDVMEEITNRLSK